MGLQKLIFSETNPCLEYVPSNASGISDSLGADRGLGGRSDALSSETILRTLCVSAQL